MSFDFCSFHKFLFRNRDEFIKVDFNNIIEAYHSDFKKADFQSVSMFDTPYDYGSILHYPPGAYAKDGSKPAMIPLFRADNMGQRNGKKALMNSRCWNEN
jgi:Astacin (Peptidase family M12A)